MPPSQPPPFSPLFANPPPPLPFTSLFLSLSELRMNGERRGGEAETQTRCLVCGNLIVAGNSERERESERERAKVSHFSPVWSIEQTLSSFPALNGITVPASLGSWGGGLWGSDAWPDRNWDEGNIFLSQIFPGTQFCCLHDLPQSFFTSLTRFTQSWLKCSQDCDYASVSFCTEIKKHFSIMLRKIKVHNFNIKIKPILGESVKIIWFWLVFYSLLCTYLFIF